MRKFKTQFAGWSMAPGLEVAGGEDVQRELETSEQQSSRSCSETWSRTSSLPPLWEAPPEPLRGKGRSSRARCPGEAPAFPKQWHEGGFFCLPLPKQNPAILSFWAKSSFSLGPNHNVFVPISGTLKEGKHRIWRL